MKYTQNDTNKYEFQVSRNIMTKTELEENPLILSISSL